MILTPFAAASTVTTFSDGSSEVVIEFKDGFNSVNNTDGGFYLVVMKLLQLHGKY